MTPQQRKELHLWLQEEYEAIKAEPYDKASDPGCWIAFAADCLALRFLKQDGPMHYSYNGFRQLLSEWLITIASAAELRDYAALRRQAAADYKRQLGGDFAEAFAQKTHSKMIAEATAIEQLAESRKAAPNPNN